MWICEPGKGPARLRWPRHPLRKAYDLPVAGYSDDDNNAVVGVGVSMGSGVVTGVGRATVVSSWATMVSSCGRLKYSRALLTASPAKSLTSVNPQIRPTIRGWTRTDPQRPWHAPAGEPFWETDEALRLALSAEALDPARDQERPAAIDADSRREFINNILAHDALLDEVDALLFEHVVEGRQAAVAAELRRLTLAAVTAATPADWEHIAERLIADTRELEADARHHPTTDPPRSPER